MGLEYLREASMKAITKKYGRRVGRSFLTSFDARVRELFERACQQKDGGRVTMDDRLACFTGCAPKEQATSVKPSPRKR